jgi:APA family basic amino acid/polyamine antiporter
VWLVTVLSAAGCLFIMRGLPRTAWERFGIWLGIGLIVYVAYGWKHSRLRTAGVPVSDLTREA